MNKLPFNTDSLESLPEAIHSFYTKTDDGKFTLSIDGSYIESSKLDEFRSNNIQLKQEKEDIEKRLNDLTTQFNAAKDDDKGNTQPSDRVQALETRFGELNQQLADLNKQLADKDETLTRKTKEDQIRSAATALEIPATAHIDIINRVLSQSHKFENDKITFEAFADDSGNAYDVKTFIDKEIRQSAPHFFIQKSGTGQDPKGKAVISDFNNLKKDDVITSNDLFRQAFSSDND